MIWLASFPRSGNTFFRIVLHEVYGIDSRAFRLEKLNKLNKEYYTFPVVKTHLLPDQIQPSDSSIPAVYIVRDGRDAVISMAHQMKDMHNADTEFQDNLIEVIKARKGTHFGGWSGHVEAWLKRSDIIIRFEDLIKDPITEVEKLRPILEMPEPEVDKLPSFQDLRTKFYPFGAVNRPRYTEEQKIEFTQKFFRKGQTGNWKTEMSEEVHRLFWKRHGKMMRKLGYTEGMPPIERWKRLFN